MANASTGVVRLAIGGVEVDAHPLGTRRTPNSEYVRGDSGETVGWRVDVRTLCSRTGMRIRSSTKLKKVVSVDFRCPDSREVGAVHSVVAIRTVFGPEIEHRPGEHKRSEELGPCRRVCEEHRSCQVACRVECILRCDHCRMLP